MQPEPGGELQFDAYGDIEFVQLGWQDFEKPVVEGPDDSFIGRRGFGEFVEELAEDCPQAVLPRAIRPTR